MAINYASKFLSEIEQQYSRELTSSALDRNKKFNFLNAKTVNVPTMILSGYKDHARDGSKNRGVVNNTYQPMAMVHDRDIEFFVDEADVDQTNLVLSAANVTGTFNSEQAIPELDAYRYSKLYADFVTAGGVLDNTVLSKTNILTQFDAYMEDMDEAGVPEEGRVLYVIPKVYTMLKQADAIQKTLDVSGSKDINRKVRSLDDVEIVKVPSARMKSAYDFTEGFVPAVAAKQINMMLVHPMSVIAPIKYTDIYLWNKGETPDSAFGFLYQNRSYVDLFLIEAKKAGVKINADA